MLGLASKRNKIIIIISIATAERRYMKLAFVLRALCRHIGGVVRCNAPRQSAGRSEPARRQPTAMAAEMIGQKEMVDVESDSTDGHYSLHRSQLSVVSVQLFSAKIATLNK